MTANLYDVLGVDKRADQAAIRKAYRSRAKKAHPDTGGSVESFDLVKLAHDCLSDAERRRRYDETGQVDPTSADNEAAQILNVAIGAVNAVMATSHQHNIAWETFDILGDATRQVSSQIGQIEWKIKEGERNAEKLRAAAGRFKAKVGKVNKLGPMIEAQAAEQERGVETMKRDKAKLDAARTLLKEHDFDYKKQAAQMGGVMFFNTVKS
jgi:curved DNA-binding protein CbpA